MNDLLQFMKQVGVGKSGARSLDRASADQAMTAVLEGRFHPVTFGAFFMGLRYKGEDAEELAGFLAAMYRTSQPCTTSPPDGLLNCAGAYDGKARTCNVAIPASLVAVAAGVPIALHGAPGIPTKFGMTTGHVLAALGINIERPLDAVGDDLHAVGIGYVEQSAFHPNLHTLLDARVGMGKRTILNTMETLSNPFGATSHLGGFFHDPYADLVCHALQKGCSTFGRVTLVKGIEGSDELRPGAVFIARLVDGDYTREAVNSDELGLPMHISELSAPTESIEQRISFSAQQIRELLDSPHQGSAFKNAVILNAAIRITAAGKTDNIGDAVATATHTLEGGAASGILEQWKTRTRAV